MTYMDIKPAATTELDQYLDWTNHLTARLVSSVGKKMEITPEIGELRIQWYTELKQAIQALIAKECTKARIEELEEVIKRNNYGMTKSQLGTLDRIKEIKRSKE